MLRMWNTGYFVSGKRPPDFREAKLNVKMRNAKVRPRNQYPVTKQENISKNAFPIDGITE